MLCQTILQVDTSATEFITAQQVDGVTHQQQTLCHHTKGDELKQHINGHTLKNILSASFYISITRLNIPVYTGKLHAEYVYDQ